MVIEIVVKNYREIRRLLQRAPDRFAAAFNTAARRALSKYRGFHRKNRMSRRGNEPVGVFATKKGQGIKQDRWFPVWKLGNTLNTAGAEIRVKNLVIKQLEFGAVRSGRGSMAVPFSKHQLRGKAKKSLLKKLKSGSKKVFVVKTKSGRKFIVERRPGSRFGFRPGTNRVKRSERWEFLFHFQRKVRIGKRLQFAKLFRDRYRAAVMKELQRQLNREIVRMNSRRAA